MPSYDPRALRRGRRSGGERGLWTYIPAEELEKLRNLAADPPPLYRLAARVGGRTIVIQLFPAEPGISETERGA